MPRLRRTTNASSMFPLVSCRAFRQSPMGAPDFSRRSFTNFASIFSLTVVISLFESPCFQPNMFRLKEKRGGYQGPALRPAHKKCAQRSLAGLGCLVFVQ